MTQPWEPVLIVRPRGTKNQSRVAACAGARQRRHVSNQPIKLYALSSTNVMVVLLTDVRSPQTNPFTNAVMRTIPCGWRK